MIIDTQLTFEYHRFELHRYTYLLIYFIAVLHNPRLVKSTDVETMDTEDQLK